MLYGAAEFSRDLDITLLASPENLARLRNALANLQAEPIAVPPFEREYLDRGHAVHFRCHRPDTEGMRLAITPDSLRHLLHGSLPPTCERIEVCLFTAEPGADIFDAADVVLMERRPIRSGRQVLRFVTDRKPTHAGIDPCNFYVDRNSADNVRPVK